MGNKLQTEIQSLNCPTTYEQEKKWKILLNKLNANNNNQIVFSTMLPTRSKGLHV